MEVDEIVQRGQALLFEYHSMVGCDPSCEARYHELFDGMTLLEWKEEVGDIKGDWESMMKVND